MPSALAEHRLLRVGPQRIDKVTTARKIGPL